MLTDLAHLNSDPVTSMIAVLNGNHPTTERLEIGCYRIGHFSSDMVVWGRNNFKDDPDLGPLNNYGICDSPEQFLSVYRPLLADHPANLAVFFTHIQKDSDNRGQGGGWRWHKWGPYVGTGNPKCEYLDDEEGFEDGVFVYHIHDISELVTPAQHAR